MIAESPLIQRWEVSAAAVSMMRWRLVEQAEPGAGELVEAAGLAEQVLAALAS